MPDLDAWNIADNRRWWVRLYDTGSAVGAELYLSQAAALAGTGLQASGVSTNYGSGLAVMMVPDDDATVDIEPLQNEYSWHIKVSGASEDETRILRVGPFVELPEISHSIYRDARLIEARATAEIDAHTHADIVRTATLGVHLPELEPGNTAQISSARRGFTAIGQVGGHRIAGDRDRLTSTLDIHFYTELTR